MWTKVLPEPGPIRTLTLASLVASVGYGLYLAGSAVYFLRFVGLGPTQVGIGLSLSALSGFFVSIPIGKLADRAGARRVALILAMAQAVVLVAMTQARSFAVFLVLIALLGVAENGANVARGALLAGVVHTSQRVRASAYGRATFNVGFTVGAFGAGLAMAWDTQVGYRALMVGNAATAVTVYLILSRLPEVVGRRRRGDPRVRVSRDYPYVAVSVLAGLASLGDTILTVGLPVWIVSRTSAPASMAAWLIMLNTLLVILLQVRVARRAEAQGAASRMQVLAFGCLAAACLITGLSPLAWPSVAVAVLIVVVVLLTVGELWGETARWSLRYGLAPEHAHGAYGGLFAMGSTIPALAAPAFITWVTARFDTAGWAVLAALFLLSAGLTRPTIRMAERTRPTGAPAPEATTAPVGAPTI